jgi:hypothetical protein
MTTNPTQQRQRVARSQHFNTTSIAALRKIITVRTAVN